MWEMFQQIKIIDIKTLDFLDISREKKNEKQINIEGH